MKKTIQILLVLLLGNAGAGQDQCASVLSMKDVGPAIGTDIRMQPVYSPKGITGWRVWGADTSPQLTTLGIGQGALLTQVCGMAASEIVAKNYQVCCGVDVSAEFEVTFHLDDMERKVLIRRLDVPAGTSARR